MKPHVLIAEDEENVANALELNLKLEGYEVTLCHSGTAALSRFSQDPAAFDLALLDVMMPGMTGFDLCSELRKSRPNLPVIFLTARSAVADRREGLKIGADDYITKPFDLEELLLRVRNLIKRSVPARDSVFMFAGGSINFRTYEIVSRSGASQTLSRREIGLLELLTGEPGRVFSRDEIIDALWEPAENASSRTIDNYILSFRKMFESDPRSPRHFHSIRGVGYKFTV